MKTIATRPTFIYRNMRLGLLTGVIAIAGIGASAGTVSAQEGAAAPPVKGGIMR